MISHIRRTPEPNFGTVELLNWLTLIYFDLFLKLAGVCQFWRLALQLPVNECMDERRADSGGRAKAHDGVIARIESDRAARQRWPSVCRGLELIGQQGFRVRFYYHAD